MPTTEKDFIISYLGSDVYNLIYEYADDPDNIEGKYAAGLLMMQRFSQFFFKKDYKYNKNLSYETVTFYTDRRAGDVRFIMFGRLCTEFKEISYVNLNKTIKEIPYLNLTLNLNFNGNTFVCPGTKFRLFINEDIEKLKPIQKYLL